MPPVTLSTSKWTPIGPAPIKTAGGLIWISGRAAAAVSDPKHPATIYVAGDNGGIWKNINPPNWTPLTDFQPSLNFAGGAYHPLVIHPANHDLVLAIVSGQGAGLLKSTDAGNSWQLLANNQFDGQALNSIAVHPANTDNMYLVANWNGLWQSTDGGVTWNQLSLPGGAVTDVIIARFDPKVLFTAVVGNSGAQQAQNGIYRSTDSGATWTLLSGAPNGSALVNNNPFPAVRLESGTAKDVVYASMLTLSPPPPPLTIGIQRFRSNNNGNTWKILSPTGGNLENRLWHLLFAVDPKDDDHIFANDAYTLWESFDGGKKWTEADNGIGYLSGINHFDWTNLSFDVNGDALCTADQGVNRYSRKSGWTSLMGDIEISEFYTIGLDPNSAKVAYAVGQDIFSEKFSGDTVWNLLEGGIGETGKIVVDPTNSNRLLAFNPGSQDNSGNPNNAFVMRSPDAGATWKAIFDSSLLSANFVSVYKQSQGYGFAYASQKAFALDPSNPSRLLAVADVVYECTNADSASPTWAPISGVLSGDPNNPFVIALAISPSDGNTVYAATQDSHLWVTNDGGASWNQFDSGISGAVIDIRIDPNDSGHVFAITGGGVWHLQSSSLPWVNITGGIPGNLGLRTIFVVWQSAIPALFVGTDRGIYRSFDLGNTWTKWGPALPNTSVNDLQGEMFGSELLLAAGTYGRGAWEILVRGWGSIATAIANHGNFGHVCVGSFVDELLTINNNGWGPLLITKIDSSDPAEFEPPSVLSYPLLLAPGDSIDVMIRFRPNSLGAKSAIVTIFSNDPAGPHKVPVSGEALPPRLALLIANSGNFGKACVGSFVDEPLVLNNSGKCTLWISDISSSSPDFVPPQAVSYPLSIAPGTSLPAPIRFAPTSIGPKLATITVFSNDPAGPQSIDVSGEAPSGKLAVCGSTNFGGVTACCCADRTISICNVGECSLNVTSVGFKRKSKHWTLINNPFPATLQPGSCLCVVIRYKATEKCARACELIIESDDPETPVKTLEVLAYTVWNDCGCGKHHKGGCSQGYPCCCDDDEDPQNES